MNKPINIANKFEKLFKTKLGNSLYMEFFENRNMYWRLNGSISSKLNSHLGRIMSASLFQLKKDLDKIQNP